jgi:putative holliday junction resolvase
MPERQARLILSFDFGTRRIGIASGDTISGTATPLAAALCTPRGPDWLAIDKQLKSYGPDLLVVGTPYNVDGTPGSLHTAAAEFAAALAARSGLPVERVDERYSSLEASAELKAQRAAGTRKRRVARADVDSTAAAVMLRRWLQGERDAGGHGPR